MKKILMSIMLTMGLTTSAMADHEVFVNKTNEAMTGGQEIFFGKISDYEVKAQEIVKSLKNGVTNPPAGISQTTWNTMQNTLAHGLTGFGTGLVFSMFSPFINEMYADQEYVLIKTNGVDYKAVTFIGDKHPAMSEAEIKALLSRY